MFAVELKPTGPPTLSGFLKSVAIALIIIGRILQCQKIAEFKKTVTELFDAFDSFGQQLMEAIAIYLGLENNYFDSQINEGNSVLRTIHYPPADEDIGERAGAHGDINLITLLIGGNKPGLEILVDDTNNDLKNIHQISLQQFDFI